MAHGYTHCVRLVLGDFPAGEVVRALRAGGVRVKPRDLGRARDALLALSVREFPNNRQFHRALLQSWERRRPELARQCRAAVEQLLADPATDGTEWVRGLAGLVGWAEALRGCLLLCFWADPVYERVLSDGAMEQFNQWAREHWDEFRAAAEGPPAPAEPLPAPASGGPAGAAKEGRLATQLKEAQRRLRQEREEREALGRRLKALTAKLEAVRRELHRTREERDLARAQLKAVREWPAPRERVLRLLQALEKVLGQRETALAQRDEALTQRDEALAQRDEAVAQRDEALAQRDEALAQVAGSANELDQWRQMAPPELSPATLAEVAAAEQSADVPAPPADRPRRRRAAAGAGAAPMGKE